MATEDREEDREYGWDDEIVNEGQDFEPLPAGDYDFTINHVERGRSQGSEKLPPCNMATVYFDIHGKDHDIAVKENYILHSRMEWKLSQLFRAVGLKKKDEPLKMNWTALPGLRGKAKIKLIPGYKDPTKMYDAIDTLYPSDDGPKNYTPGTF